VTVKNNDGQTPMNVVLTSKQQFIVGLLLNSERNNRHCMILILCVTQRTPSWLR
jgi:hypothetical protein